MANTYRGTLSPLLQRITDHTSPTSGFTRELEYMGMEETRARALAGYYETLGVDVQVSGALGKWSVVISDTTGSYTIDTWEIAANQIQPLVFENPLIQAIGTAGGRAVVQFAIETGLKPAEAVSDFNKSTELKAQYNSGSDVAWPTEPALIRLYDRGKKGKTEYASTGYVLRHTTNVSNRWSVNIADVGVNMLYGTATLLSEAQSSGLWIYPLPGRLAYKINNIPVPAVQTGYYWSWLKSASSESTSANNRVNIVTDYTLDQWSTDLYETY
jgi:hypothetical protein